VGVVILIVGKLFWLISESKLTILREMKEFELRMMDMMKK